MCGCDACRVDAPPSASSTPGREPAGDVSAASVSTWVRVRAYAQIVATLDSNGTTEGLPFMPEMIPFCGTYAIARPADRVCLNGFRRLDRVCHLETTRCSGTTHNRCEAGCLLFWHESWLESAVSTPARDDHDNGRLHTSPGVPLPCVDSSTGKYICQATAVCHLGTELPVPGPHHLLRDFLKGRVGWREAKLLWSWTFNYLLFSLYTALHRRRRSCPTINSDIAIGDMVRVRSRLDILGTLGPGGSHFGLRVTPDMLRYCGKAYRVVGKVSRIIEPETGEMRDMKNECIVLEGVTCSGGRSLCSRRELFYWREAWLEKS